MATADNRIRIRYPKPNQAVITRLFPATPTRLWRAFTDPSEVMQWYGAEYGRLTRCENDIRNGGWYLYTMQVGADYTMRVGADQEVTFRGLVHQAQAPYRMRATEQRDDFEGRTYELDLHINEDPHDGSSRLSLKLTYESQEDRDAHIAKGAEASLNASYCALDDLVWPEWTPVIFTRENEG